MTRRYCCCSTEPPGTRCTPCFEDDHEGCESTYSHAPSGTYQRKPGESTWSPSKPLPGPEPHPWAAVGAMVLMLLCLVLGVLGLAHNNAAIALIGGTLFGSTFANFSMWVRRHG